ncbi:MAG: LacI family transcriptional regulator, partial [Chloroflexi bacterium]|nr:LacI family transcriptional regulator [Chloroflexota bacterium]
MRFQIAGHSKAALVVASLALGVAACASPAGSSPAGSGGAQVVQTAAAGATCTNDKYNTAGVPKLDLKNATVGFAQSEKEANPFRIAETQSIKDEATKLGIKLITTNAESDLNKEISDIKGMIDQGAQALIISPL